MSPTVSVVVPTRNRAQLLRRTLRSIRAQTVPVEIVVVDDGSDQAVESGTAPVGTSLRVLRHERAAGVAVARNEGLAACTSRWVAFCDDDDVWAPDKLAAQLTVLEKTSASWSAVGVVSVDMAGRIVRGDLPPDGDIAAPMLEANRIPGGASGVVARADVVRDVGGFDVRLTTLADWDLWIRLALVGPVASVSRPLVAYALHVSNMSYDIGQLRRERKMIDEKHEASRRALHVDLDDEAERRYEAQMSQRAGRRLRPAAYHVRVAARRRRLGPLRAATRALLDPSGALAAHDEAKAAELPTGWLEEAEAWLPDAWEA